MKNKKSLILIIIINILLVVTKFFIILDASIRTYLNDDVVFRFKDINYLPLIIGSLICIGLDLFINYLAVKISEKKYNIKYKYYKVIIVPIIITIVFIILGLI